MEDNGVRTSVQIPGVVVDEVPHGAVGSAAPVALAADSATVDPAVAAGAAVAGDPAAAVDSATVDAPVVDAASVEAGEPAAAEKKKTTRGAGMAAGGQPVEAPGPPPGRPAWPAQPMNPDEVYVPQEFDVTDLAEVNRQLNQARARLFRVSQALKMVQRTLAEAQSDYDREMRRQLVTISGGTSESRRAMAEIRCEQYENRIIVGKQVVEEWKKRATDCRDDLKAIENIAHNVRAQIDIR